MNRSQRLTVIFVLVAMLIAIPTTALANKKLFFARLSTGAELHEVVGSRASGTAGFGTALDGTLRFQVYVNNLSGPVTGAHIHGPADATQTAPVIVTLCGSGPGVPVLATCTYSNGTLSIEGTIRGINLTGVNPQDFFTWLDSGQTYVNVHTALNPAGEARGQILLP
jgi:hypothetical protein